MQSHGNNRSRAADELGDEVLLDEMKRSDVILAGHEENGLGRVEACRDYLASFGCHFVKESSKSSNHSPSRQSNNNKRKSWERAR